MSGNQAPTSSGDRPSEPTTRRSVLSTLLKTLTVLWGAGFVYTAASYLRLPQKLKPTSRQAVEAGPFSEFTPGYGKLVTGNMPLWVVMTGDGALVALSSLCTHRRCILEWERESERLVCPCHDGAFDLNGNVLQGPPPRPLVTHSVAVKAGTVYVYL